MTDAEMRKEIMDMYPNGKNWHRRVEKMPANQVFAIYQSKINREKPVEKIPEREEYHQIDIWEWLIERGAYEQKAEGAN